MNPPKYPHMLALALLVAVHGSVGSDHRVPPATAMAVTTRKPLSV